jgi:hypothetical protein
MCRKNVESARVVIASSRERNPPWRIFPSLLKVPEFFSVRGAQCTFWKVGRVLMFLMKWSQCLKTWVLSTFWYISDSIVKEMDKMLQFSKSWTGASWNKFELRILSDCLFNSFSYNLSVHNYAASWTSVTNMVDLSCLPILWQMWTPLARFSFQLCSSLLGGVESIQLAVL